MVNKALESVLAILTVLLFVQVGCSAKKSGEPCAPDDSGYCVERVSITAEDGTVLVGDLYRKDASAPAVLFLHQLARDRSEWNSLRGALLADRPYTVLAMDLRGHGESTRQGEETIAWQDFTNEDWAMLPGDAHLAFSYLKGREDLSPAAYGAAGASIGSSAVLLEAAADEETATVVLLSPGIDYRGLEAVPAMSSMGSRTSLLVATTGDTASASAVSQLAAVSTAATPIIYPSGNSHGVYMADEHPALIPLFVDWFREEL